MKNLFIFLILVLSFTTVSFSQVTVYESFDNSSSLPTGWATSVYSGSSQLWAWVSAGSYPVNPCHNNSAGMVQYDSWNSSSNTEAILVTPSFDLSQRGSATATVSLWLYRHTTYSSYRGGELKVYINNTTGLSGATQLSLSDNSTVNTIYTQMDSVPSVSSAGWYYYTFTIPSSYTGSTNYLIFKGRSDYYNNIHMDDISYTSYPPVMSYASSTTYQVTTLPLAVGSANNPIIAVEVNTTGVVNPINLTQLVFNTNGSTSASDITSAKIYYTGASGSFSTDVQFGSTVSNPSGQFTVDGSQQLTNGANYFWVVYDIASTATVGNIVDGECVSMVVAGSTYNPTVSAPTGGREIRTPRNGTYQVGTGYYYPNLYSAFSDINNLGLSGDVTLQIMTDIVEPNSAELMAPNEVGGSGYNINILPVGGHRTISGNFASTGVVVLVGADRVTIDGGETKNLTIRNDNTNMCAGLLIYSLGTGAGCTDVTVRNCNIISTSTNTQYYAVYVINDDNNNLLMENNFIDCNSSPTTGGAYGIYFSGTASNVTISNNFVRAGYFGMMLPSNFTDLTISGNTIEKMYYGMYIAGVVSNLDISDNTIGSDNSNNYVEYQGMTMYGIITGGRITNNTIFNIKSTNSSQCTGIYDAASSTDLVIDYNNIFGLSNQNTGGWGAYGINIESGTGVLVANNQISDITNTIYSPGTTYNPFGIRITGGDGHKIYYNSVNMNGTQVDYSSTGNTIAALCVIGGTNLDIRNNIFVNSTQNPGSYAVTNYAIYVSASGYISTLNYNNYYSTGDNSYLGYWASDVSTLSAWRTASTQDANSSNVEVIFLGTNDLHLDRLSATDQNLYCAPLTEVTNDIDGEARKTTNDNNMGVDNVTPIVELITDINNPEPFYCADYSMFNELSLTFEPGITGFADGIARTMEQPDFTYSWYKDGVLIEDQTENTLHIAPVLVSDAGEYYAVATFGDYVLPTSTRTVYVETPIVITQDLPEKIDGCRDAGSMQLTFGATGTINYYKWYKENVNAPGTWQQLSESGSILTIDLTDPSIEANLILRYKAEAYGPGNCGVAMLASSVTNFTLAESLRDSSVTFIDLTSPTKAAENVCTYDNIQITANAKGTVKSYNWQKYEDNTWKSITGNSTAQTANLVLNNVSTSTSGQYRCVVIGSTNCNVSQLVTNVTNISVWSLFSIVDHPETNTLLCQGDNLMLWVVTDGEVMNYQWQRDGVNLDLDKYPTANTPILMINDFTHELSGTFRCVITARDCRGTHDYPTTNSMVYVLRETEILTKDYNVTADFGEVATLEVKAHVEGAPYDFPVEVQWYRGTKPPTQANMLADDGRIAGSKSSILSINSVVEDDYGEDYFCVVTGKCGQSAVSGYYTISEPGEIEFSVQPVDVEMCKGSTATFMAEITTHGNVSYYDLQWFKDGIALGDGYKHSGVTTPVLNVFDVQDESLGNYYLVATARPSGYNFTSNTVNINLKSEPVVIRQPEPLISVQTGKQLLLEVTVVGGTNVFYQWFKDNTAISGATDAVYRIDAVTASDAGAYYCNIGSDCRMLTITPSIVSVTNFVGVNDELENGWGLSNKPNPFNNETIVNFTSPRATNAKITLSDATGREIATIFNQYVEAGIYNINVNASELNLTSGVYYYTVTADGFTKTQKMVIVK